MRRRFWLALYGVVELRSRPYRPVVFEERRSAPYAAPSVATETRVSKGKIRQHLPRP